MQFEHFFGHYHEPTKEQYFLRAPKQSYQVGEKGEEGRKGRGEGGEDRLGAAEVGKGVTFLIANKAASLHVYLSRMCGPF